MSVSIFEAMVDVTKAEYYSTALAGQIDAVFIEHPTIKTKLWDRIGMSGNQAKSVLTVCVFAIFSLL